MPCDNCNDTNPIVFSIQSFLNSSCSDCGDTTCLSSAYVCYKGAALPCSGIETDDTLETALSKLDEQICSALGDYTAYQKNCLPTWFGEEINDEATFVDAITSYACTIATNLESFTGVTFPQYQTEVAAQISEIDGPAITCASASVNSGDALNTVLTKYCTKFGEIDTALNLSVIDFGECFSVVGTPTTVIQGFVEVLSQICQVKAIAEDGTGILPTFNNTGSCLEDPGSNDTLVETVEKIRDKLCTLDVVYVADDIDWGDCFSGPDTPSLQNDVQYIIDYLDVVAPVLITEFSEDFVTELSNPSEPCQGLKLSLATPINQDRFVAAGDSDTDPGTLIEKLEEGDGISIFENEDGDAVVVSSTGELKADAADTSLGYLIDKLEGSTVNGITITPVYNPTTDKVTLQLSINEIDFCAAVSSCIPYACNSYEITPNGGEDTVSYRDCYSGATIELDISGPITVCAVVGSVEAPASVVIALGQCTTTTTATP